MNAQLLVIAAIIASSLLTITQRANAQEIGNQRWLEPNIEHIFYAVDVPDKDSDSNENYLVTQFYFPTFQKAYNQRVKVITPSFINRFTTDQSDPRAPPYFVI